MKPTLRIAPPVLLLAVAVATLLAGPIPAARACPFCSAVSLTFAQEIAQSQVAVIARLVEPPTSASLSPRADGPLPKGRLAVVEVLKGGELLDGAELVEADGARLIETIMIEVKPAGTTYLLMAVEPPKLVWGSPIPVSERGIEYLKKLADLPAKGPDRLAFFQKYLEDADDTLARDAYDEFAVAPYDDVRGLESRMDPTQLLAWIENPKVPANRRRLYATMLGICGTKADADRIGAILANADPDPARAEVRSGLDALIACYVTLKGPEGLDMVDEQFLARRDPAVPFTEKYAAVMALRFLGEESTIVPRERVLQSLRILLLEPKLADLVIADLARWGDWSVVDKLAELFETAESDNLFVREPVVNYLKACPDPHAAEVLERLAKLDPEAVRRAETLSGLAGIVAAGKPDEKGTKPDVPPAGDDADPGDPSNGAAPTAETVPAPPGPSAAEAELAARIPPVLGDEDATDETVAIDPSRPGASVGPPATAPSPAPAAAGARSADGPWMSTFGRWCGVAILLAAVALLSRMAMRSSGAA